MVVLSPVLEAFAPRNRREEAGGDIVGDGRRDGHGGQLGQGTVPMASGYAAACSSGAAVEIVIFLIE